MSRRTMAAVAAATAGLLVVGVIGAATRRTGGSAAAPTTTAAPPPPSTGEGRATTSTTAVAAGTGTVAEVVASIEAFVAAERGLAFKAPVKVALLEDDAFEARATEVDAEDAEEIAHSQAVLQAMGLLDGDADLAALVRRFTAGAVLGFYDPETDELVVRGDRPTPFVRVVLAHELLHALEDQHFDLDREDLGDEAYLGFQALAEGSALRIEERYRASLSSRERRTADIEELALGANVPDVPEVVEVIFGFPYAYGPDLVEAIVAAGGQAGLDAAYADGPTSSEHVLDPARYLEGDEPRAVPTPAADADAFDDGEIGQLFLTLMLRAELDDDDAAAAAEGWGGDHYVAWKEGGRTCMRMDFVMDTPADTAELAAALADWASKRRGSARATGTSLRTCG